MRRVRYSVAASLDGYIAGPQGEYDWIPQDPDVDFAELFAPYDLIVMGRHSYVSAAAQEGGVEAFGLPVIVASTTLEPPPGITVVPDMVAAARTLRQEDGRDIWLFGGGRLFATLLSAGLVDEVQVAVIPMLLGQGIPLLPHNGTRQPLRLLSCRTYPKTGMVMLDYAVER